MNKDTGADIRAIATKVVKQLHRAGFAAYWVGGCVRDFLLERDPHDFDIASDANPADIERIFKRTIPVGRKFGVMIVLEEGHEFQIAAFRAEADYRDGRRPERIEFADAQADATRRDFTINGMFYDPDARKVHDWVGGQADLKAKVIRTIGAPEDRFAEDHLRMLRAVRFAAQLDFTIEAATLRAVQSHAARIKLISAERIREELVKLFKPPHAARGLELLRASGLLEHVLPELVPTITCDQSPEYHPEGTVFTHIGLMLKLMLPDSHPLLPWAVLMHDIAKPNTASTDPKTGMLHFYGHEKVGGDMAEAIMGRLRFPNKQISEVATVVRHHMQFKDALKMRKATLRRILLRESFPLELQLQRLDYLGSNGCMKVYDFLVEQAAKLHEQPEVHPPLLTGDDLIDLGMKPGPAIGKLLHEIRDKQLQDELKTKAEARKWAKSQIAAKSASKQKG